MRSGPCWANKEAASTFHDYGLGNFAEIMKSESFLAAMHSNPVEVCALIRDGENQVLRGGTSLRGLEGRERSYAFEQEDKEAEVDEEE